MSKPIQISEAAFIGIHAMVLIAGSNEYLNVNIIAEKTGASKNHIAKVMQTMVKYDYVQSVRGPSGGFKMKIDPNEITLLDIFEAIEGKIHVPECPFGKEICPFDKCLMNGIFHKLTTELVDYLKSSTLAENVDVAMPNVKL